MALYKVRALLHLMEQDSFARRQFEHALMEMEHRLSLKVFHLNHLFLLK